MSKKTVVAKTAAFKVTARIPVEQITLVWECPECNKEYRGSLTDIAECGTAVCPECEVDCELCSYVEVAG